MAARASANFLQAYKDAEERRLADYALDMEHVKKARALLRTLQELCPCCLGADGVVQKRHFPSECPVVCRSSEADGFLQFRKFKEACRFEITISGGVCGFCHVPSIHDHLHGAMDGDPETCEFPDILPMLSYGIFYGDRTFANTLIKKVTIREKSSASAVVENALKSWVTWAKYQAMEAGRFTDVLPTVQMEMAWWFVKLKANANGDFC